MLRADYILAQAFASWLARLKARRARWVKRSIPDKVFLLFCYNSLVSERVEPFADQVFCSNTGK